MSDQVHQMFSRIAGRYDRANRWMSFGSDQWVRKKAVKLSQARSGESVLDCAAGTGDLTLLFQRAVGDGARVVGTDFNADMLALAAPKSERLGVAIDWQVQDAQNLAFDDESFDIVSIAYGIRNVDDPVRALSEMRRVLKPGGRLVVLEFGQPSAWARPGYLFFNRFIIPLIGSLAGGDRDAYRYLQRTSDAFPHGPAFVKMLEQAGEWQSIESNPMIFGVNYIYVATR
ncbi:MAG: bifunctional demethylmenaquinone methyltransferase/2-methoxy-6-polyprenyl-1,4-benzoquinol methylase UbiE [Wenzhouxiangellaceae bacterium]|nr:bifunctional demethylmenaquinone methyltransferase/2-methoxy-6-polyprenyl-1,4-benzoquinol methylase UbiE [Wenzhouxiangellaceae bacterium]